MPFVQSAKRIWSLLPQLPPMPVGPIAAIVRAGSPDRSTADRLPFEKNASCCPSGDQNGLDAPAVPASLTISPERSALTQSAVSPVAWSSATNARCEPVGETAPPE